MKTYIIVKMERQTRGKIIEAFCILFHFEILSKSVNQFCLKKKIFLLLESDKINANIASHEAFRHRFCPPMIYICNVCLMDGWRFHVLFNSISVISGRWDGDNETLCAVEPCLRLKRSPPQAGLELGTA